ncbi:serine beta-lactamase-like protein LACTB, mitochondrial isoform X2 [Clavelina lepadiformis]|uniref:serine beta-lactamase-like protein LACTB, mitochondrial isoform X2 n=1 Tax=Clavelina lepadiformis TaxID=159417 RepID=UPI0040436055
MHTYCLLERLAAATIGYKEDHNKHFQVAIQNSEQHIIRIMEEFGAPGMAVAVSIDGVTVWKQVTEWFVHLACYIPIGATTLLKRPWARYQQHLLLFSCLGFGYADVENKVPCTPSSVMRVASISKSFTAMAAARLMEEGKLDLDKNIQEYVSFPEKFYEGKKVVITLRQLLSNSSGIRHYHKTLSEARATSMLDILNLPENNLTKQYESVTDALEIFQKDPLLFKPGEKYWYSTHGWTLVSAILEKVSGRDFLSLMQDNFHRLGMNETHADVHKKLIHNRSRYYIRKDGKLENAPYVNNSYKWAGAGFLSSVGDLIKFGNAMMYSFQLQNQKSSNSDLENNSSIPGILRADTVREMWRSVILRKRGRGSKMPENISYGLGWEVYPSMKWFGLCPKWQLEVAHSGLTCGASSILFLVPRRDSLHFSNQTLIPNGRNISQIAHCFESDKTNAGNGIKGIAVAILTNIHGINLTSVARDIANEFVEHSADIFVP